jgi:hypothetical protein
MGTLPDPAHDHTGSARPCPNCMGGGLLDYPDPEPESEERHTCWFCGSHADPYFSRVVPMGYHCPSCGKEDR